VAGLPISRFAVALVLALIAITIVAIVRSRIHFPVREYLPFAGVFAITLILLGRPMIEFGFGWISYANDDMANYVLSAHRVADGAFFDPPNGADLASGKDYSQYFWLMDVAGMHRPGGQMLLALLMGLTGLKGYQAFMPLILAFHLALTSGAAALAYQSRAMRKPALVTAALLGASAIAGLGALYQLLAQAIGMALLIAVAVLVMPRWRNVPREHLIRYGVLLGVTGAALIIAYPEATPFVVAAAPLHLILGLVRRRVSLRSLALVVAGAVITLAVTLNLYLPAPLVFLALQGQGGFESADPNAAVFPYYLIPSGLAVLWGFQRVDSLGPEPLLSLSIVAGAALLIITSAAALRLAWRGEPAAAFVIVMVALSIRLFLGRADFGLFKLAMFVQPFLLATLAISIHSKTLRRPLIGVVTPIVIGLAGLPAQQAYVNQSRGDGSLAGIPGGSTSPVWDPFRSTEFPDSSASILSDSSNVVIAKLQALNTQHVSTSFPSRPYFGQLDDYYNRIIARFGQSFYRFTNVADQANALLTELDRKYHTATFKSRHEPHIANTFISNDIGRDHHNPNTCDYLLGTGMSQTILNRSSVLSRTNRNTFTESCNSISNWLIFVHSSLGQHYYLGKPAFISMYQLESDVMRLSKTFAGVGRLLLFEVINPTNDSRVILDVTATFKGDGDNQIPSAEVIGENSSGLETIGRGSARVVSPIVSTQSIDGRHFIMVDMGSDGQRFPVRRSGLMNLYGTDVSLDGRSLTAFARDISLVSDSQYREWRAPTLVVDLPTYLAQPEAEYSGLYEDGWVSEHFYLTLNQTAETSDIAVDGEIPMVDQPEFTANASLLLDGSVIAEKTVGVGAFELSGKSELPEGKHKVEVRFDAFQRLPGSDRRPVGGRVRQIGFRQIDIADSSISLGSGWYSYENFEGESFRWVGGDAELHAKQDADAEAPGIELDVAPGPSVDPAGFSLALLDQHGTTLDRVWVTSRQRVRFALPPQDGIRTFYLRAEGANSGPASVDDPRQLNFRVFRIGAAQGSDIANGNVTLGQGWYEYETFAGESFRWVGGEAELSVRLPSQGAGTLEVETAPGPSMEVSTLDLVLLDDQGSILDHHPLRGREKATFRIPPSASESRRLRLRADGAPSGQIAPGDPRRLDFRVFSIHLRSGEQG
jgi:hypothetical protein